MAENPGKLCVPHNFNSAFQAIFRDFRPDQAHFEIDDEREGLENNRMLIGQMWCAGGLERADGHNPLH